MPTDLCPKCGMNEGAWDGPHFMRGNSYLAYYGFEATPDQLRYACVICGYIQFTPTKDATPHAPQV